MIVLDEPFVSQTLLHYLEDTQIPVLRNDFSREVTSERLNLMEEEDFIHWYEHSKNPCLYTVSEYALDWVCSALTGALIVKQVLLLKDKVSFRKSTKELYNDLIFTEIRYADLFDFNILEVALPVVLKPSVGFLSTGVYTIVSVSDWNKAIKDIQENFLRLAAAFPDSVVGNSCFILESYIRGREFAIDLYFKEKEPVIISIFEHPFASEVDVSDRIYTTNKALYDEYLSVFVEHIKRLNNWLNLSNIPVHLEIRVKNGRIVPIEINPLRFAGLCLNELHTHITGKHPLSYYFSGTRPDYLKMWAGKENKTFCFTIIEKPKCLETASLDFNKLRSVFSKILEIRKVENPKLGIYAFIFSEIEATNKLEITNILNLDVSDYVTNQ